MFLLRKLARFADAVCRRPLLYVWSIRSIQTALIAVSMLGAYALRFDFDLHRLSRMPVCSTVAVALLLKIAVFPAFGIGRGVWRYFSMPDLIRLAACNAVASAAIGAALPYLCPGVPRSVLVLDLLLCFLLSAGARAAARALLELPRDRLSSERRRTWIYGAGQTGVMLLRDAESNLSFPHRICGFLDDDPAKASLRIHGLPVFAGSADLAGLANQFQIQEILIATPSASGAEMSRIIGRCHSAGLPFRTVPAMSQLVAGRCYSSQLRDVKVEDILGRSAVVLDHQRISHKLRGRLALVTGAGGSIGSELCRQIARFEPAGIVAFEIGETALFEIEQAMRREFPHVRFWPEIGSIQDPRRLCEVFGRYRPALVYHAAAYKHVPMMERHVFEAVENNVIGTFNVATAAAAAGVEDFVMISSDKAVRPTSMMGVTKRVAEVVLRSIQNGGPRYVSVRFGNVLGSNGSVVPIFKRQIAAGGPITVTHPEMRRYFMTIPEAVQLVLQASTMGEGGEIFVLDMGQPVRIADLARQLVLLTGLKPDEDIRIEFTGMRPGEKLYEELNVESEFAIPTYHEKIKIFAGCAVTADSALRHLAALRGACERRDLAALVLELKDIVPDYAPSRGLLERSFSGDLGRFAAVVAGGTAGAEMKTSTGLAALAQGAH